MEFRHPRRQLARRARVGTAGTAGRRTRGRLPLAGGNCPGRHGDRLQGQAPRAEAARGAEDDSLGLAGDARGASPVPPRGRAGREPRSSQHRADLRGPRSGRHALLQYEAGRRGQSGSATCHLYSRSAGHRSPVVTLAQALHYAHGKGFIHCDLKPSNVLIDRDGQPQITDFGLGRRTAENSSLTATGAILGTPSCMAPEQAAGQRQSIGPATDVYGLGAILYELLTGRPPFRTSTMMETVLQVLERDPVAPRELVPGLPRELETICLKCLEKMPQDRYSTAQELANDLERFLQGDVVEATGVFQKLRRWTRREPEVVSRIGGLSVVALLTEFNHQF